MFKVLPVLVAAGCVAAMMTSVPAFALEPPASPPADTPLKAFVTSVEADKSITFRLFAPAAKSVAVVLGQR